MFGGGRSTARLLARKIGANSKRTRPNEIMKWSDSATGTRLLVAATFVALQFLNLLHHFLNQNQGGQQRASAANAFLNTFALFIS